MITVSHLSKKYGDFLAVDDLSFTIEDGHIYGFLGPNGAGKSTTLNIMTGCLAATSGEVKIGEYDIFEKAKEAKKRIGYLPEIPPLYVEQTPREYLLFVAEAKGIKKSEIMSEIEKVIGETHIETMADRLIKHLSKGYRQRVGIAQALLGNPEIIILDEPTVGLDPMQIIEIRDLILELGQNHTVILSSHILPEIQAICDKVLIIYKGKLIAFDHIDNLSKTLAGGNSIDLRAKSSEEEAKAILSNIAEIESVQTMNCDEKEVVLRVSIGEADPDVVCENLSYAFATARKPILGLTPNKTSLEDIFIELTTEAEPTNTTSEEKEDNESC